MKMKLDLFLAKYKIKISGSLNVKHWQLSNKNLQLIKKNKFW